MKKSTIFTKVSKSFLILCLLIAMESVMKNQNVSAQTIVGTCVVLQQPCNNNGVLVTKITSGATLPLTFVYVENNSSVTHSNIHAFSDTLRGIQTCSSVTVTDSLNHTLQLKTGITTPFTISVTTSSATCPQKGGSAIVTINSSSKPDSSSMVFLFGTVRNYQFNMEWYR